jgi:UDP-N-acetyl-D-mannosaminuronic acid dehydrogenase
MSTICVLGLGYIGLPTASMFAAQGHQVLGVDINAGLVDRLSRGEVHIQEPGLNILVQSATQSGNLRVGLTVEPSDVYIIAVPTPFAHGSPNESTAQPRPDLSHVEAAARSIVPHLAPGNLVILESTSPPGTTRDVLPPILESSGLTCGDGFALAYCAERVLPGHILTELVTNDRVIGGIDDTSAHRARDLYTCFVEGSIYETDATTAEMVKLMENTFRDVNIALANEFSVVADRIGIDVTEAIALANHHPRVNILRPGPGVGGHCIAVDPWFIVDAARDVTQLIRAAREVNDSQPERVAGLIGEAVQDIEAPTIALLGLAYKSDVDDMRESPAVEVVRHLRAQGHQLRLHDPLVEGQIDDVRIDRDLSTTLFGADIMAVLTDHSMYRQLDPSDLRLARMTHKRLFDARGTLDRLRWQAAGFTVTVLGARPRHARQPAPVGKRLAAS